MSKSPKKPTILIMGRPNVGKSTLINQLIGERKAIVLDTPGVTRDLAYYPCAWKQHALTLIDSGGVFLGKVNDIYLQSEIESKVKTAIQASDLILFITDAKTGLLEPDRVLAKYLHQQGKKVLLVVNKMDNPERVGDVSPFYRLGFDSIFAISAAHGFGIDAMMASILEMLESKPTESVEEPPLRIALIGRPNVGKSSLINAIFNEPRVIVDEKAGTTRDAIECEIKVDAAPFTLIDTAGIRKNKKAMDEIEYFSTLRSSHAIESSDVVAVLLDATRFLEDQDKKIINLVLDAGKNLIVFVNKWDATDRTDQTRKDLIARATYFMPTLAHFPFIFGSATQRHQVFKLFSLATTIFTANQKRLNTAKLNDFIERVIRRLPPPSKNGKPLRIYYVTQTSVSPPTFVFFVNQPSLVSDTYARFIEKHLREFCGGLLGTPVQLHFRPRHKNLSQ